MTFYTVVVTLMQDLEQLLSSYGSLFPSSNNPFTEEESSNNPFTKEESSNNPFTKEEMEILYNTVCLTYSLLKCSAGQSFDHALEERFSDVAHKAEHSVNVLLERCLPGPRLSVQSFIEVPDEKLRDLILWYGTGNGRYIAKSDDPSLTAITGEFFSINEELKKIHGNRKAQIVEIASSTEGKLSTTLMPLRRAPNTEGKLVGLGEDLVTMLDSLTGHPSQLKALSIVGMAGIGKTTFAKQLYNDPLVVHHFFVRAWVTVSQQYQVQDMLLGVLRCVTIVSDEICERSNEDLREQVYKILKGKRYLIVLDDMWDTEAWDDLKRIFPDDMNGSRIMLTSRLREVAVHASQDTSPHCLRCLSIEESWELLSSKIFGDGSCPLELVDIGKHIAYKCQGLPLALVVIGGILSKMNKKIEVWEEVAQSVRSLVMEEAETCLNILALSYNHLPDYLKPCFLYMGIFPEDHEISVKRLILLWVAEGFIMPPSTLKSLEEVAMDYLMDLITRSLIQVKTASSDGRIKSCSIHDMTRELCLRESQKHNFFHVINRSGQAARNPQRFSFHSATNEYIHSATPLIHCRSFICFEKLSISSRRSRFVYFRLLKVLDIMNIYISNILEDIKYLSLLKFLALTINDSSSITDLFMCHSLQTLIVDCEWSGQLPRMFWYMPELRHLHLKRSCLSYSQSYSTFIGLELLFLRPCLTNLRSMSTVRPISCTEQIFRSMPHLKKLGIYETEDDHPFRGWFAKLFHLQDLETLKYMFCNPFVSSRFKPDRLPSWISFPPKLVKLTLSGTSFPWDDMVKLSMLPNLEVLKLRNYAFCGAVWRSQEGGFRCLRFLSIGSTNLEIWEAGGTHFPKLERLVLRHCRSLREIPYGIGEAPLLENIELRCCKDSAVISARLIQEEQQSFGNDGLTLRIIDG